MPTFKFKNGEEITAATLEEARAMRQAAPSVSPQPPPKPMDIFKDPNVQKQIIANPKAGSELLKAAAGIQSVTGTDKTLKEKFNPDDSIKNILAMRVLKQRLGDIMGLKRGLDKEGRVAEFYRSPGDTGPIAGRTWRATSDFSGTGTEKPIGLLSTLIGAKYPKEQAKRGTLESAVKELQEIAFFKGGKALTGREMAVTIGPLPGMYDDEDTFYAKAERASAKTIPNTIKQHVQILLDVGWSPDDVKALLTMPDEEVTKAYDVVKPKNQDKVVQ